MHAVASGCNACSAHGLTCRGGAHVGSQEQGLDTVDANRALGLPDDCREYTSVRNILRDLGIKSIRLIVSPQWCCMRVCTCVCVCMCVKRVAGDWGRGGALAVCSEWSYLLSMTL